MKIVLTGSIAFDYLMSFPGYFKDHILPERLDSISLSFLVESMVRLRGGVAPNIAYTLALLGQTPYLWGTVGEDFEEYRAWLENMGVDTAGARVIPEEYTASFFVNTDRSNAQIASFYPGAMRYAKNHPLSQLGDDRPDLVVISPNDPDAMNLYVVECQEMGLPYIYDPSQQIVRLTTDNLKKGMESAKALFVNDYEFALIEKATGMSVTDILNMDLASPEKFIVVTRGKQGATIYTDSEIYKIPIVVPEQISDPTGVGDAFRGGFLAGYCHGLGMKTCGQMGALAATYCLETRGPQGHSFKLSEYVDRYRKLFNNGRIEVLLKEE